MGKEGIIICRKKITIRTNTLRAEPTGSAGSPEASLTTEVMTQNEVSAMASIKDIS